MNVPHYVNENKSDMRGVKSGWYAIADDGHLFSGPFLSREECLRRLTDSSHGPMSPGMLSRPIWDAYTAEMKQLATDILPVPRAAGSEVKNKPAPLRIK